MLSIWIQGFFLQASLILALGAQNIFVLNAGLRGQRPFLVASLSTLCDTVLIFVGVLGVASFFHSGATAENSSGSGRSRVSFLLWSHQTQGSKGRRSLRASSSSTNEC